MPSSSDSPMLAAPLPPALNAIPPLKGVALPTDEGEASSAETTPSTERISEGLRKLALRIQGKFINESGKSIDYALLEASSEFHQLQQLAAVLNEDPQVVPVDETARKAFFINLYNVLMIHGVIAQKFTSKHPIQAAKARGEKVSFFGDTAYLVSGLRLSLDDIEHGILRGNAARAGELPFPSEEDPRRKWTLALDARIHFALVCGAKGCPAIQVYKGTNLERGLNAAAGTFLEGETEVGRERFWQNL